MTIQTGQVNVEGARLHYETAGKGRCLVLIHAGVADHRMWDDQFLVFAERFQVVRYDTRGFGRSKTEDVPFSNRQDLRELLRHLGIGRASLCGVSRAGQIAIDFTLEYPEMVEALVLVAAGISGYGGGHEAREIETQMFTEMEEAWEQRDIPRLIELEVRMWVDGPGQPPDRVDSRIRVRVRQMESETYAGNVTEGKPQPLAPPAIDRLEDIRVPTLVVLGNLDTSGVLAMADIMARRIPGARKAVLPGTAHMLTMEKPQEFNRIILDFLSAAGLG